MKLTFSMDTDDIFQDGEDSISFEDLFREQLQKAALKEYSTRVGNESFVKYSELVADKLESELKLKLEGFLSEDIALTDKWGKPTFVGSIEDLFKSRIDDILLKGVDNNGREITGCPIQPKTWIEWKISEKLNKHVSDIVERAQRTILSEIKNQVEKQVDEITNKLIKTKVQDSLVGLLKK